MFRHSRRKFLAMTVGTAVVGLGGPVPRSAWSQESSAGRRDVAWLAEIQTPPAKLPADAPKLSELLVDRAGEPIATREAWEVHRKSLRQKWLEFLGPMPAEREDAAGKLRAAKLEVLAEDHPDGVIRQLVRYEVEPGLTTEAYLLRPAKIEKPAPGVVVFHSTVNHSIRQPAGVEGAPEKAFGLRLARRGCVAFCPRNYLWPTTDKISAQGEADKYLARVPGSRGMTKMLYDGLVATDILASQPGVDPERLGAVGHSLGAKEVLYQAAFDERIKVTVSSEGGIGTRFSNWEADWYLGPAIKENGFTREHHELLALAAPRPFLLVGGESADGDRGWPFIEAALPVYRLYGEPARVGQLNHRQGHAVPPAAEARIEEWLLTYL
ncbi:MAG: dienelactone hydrolase family protein [Pirellulaceae bacterium]|nr:dienelactone hydrolase family protein [Pirellulaceae bacterium]